VPSISDDARDVVQSLPAVRCHEVSATNLVAQLAFCTSFVSRQVRADCSPASTPPPHRAVDRFSDDFLAKCSSRHQAGRQDANRAEHLAEARKPNPLQPDRATYVATRFDALGNDEIAACLDAEQRISPHRGGIAHATLARSHGAESARPSS
jgi:hypothetical protein